MSASVSALIVAVVGVVGTLASGLLAQRSAIRSKETELDHAERQRREERTAQERREERALRRTTYMELNQALREFHAALSQRFLALEAEREPDAGPAQGCSETRQALRRVYAEAQMVAGDAVLVPVGRLVRHLHHAYELLQQHEQNARRTPPAEPLETIRERLEQTSEQLYEVRQTMRSDLGITELPVARPADHRVGR